MLRCSAAARGLANPLRPQRTAWHAALSLTPGLKREARPAPASLQIRWFSLVRAARWPQEDRKSPSPREDPEPLTPPPTSSAPPKTTIQRVLSALPTRHENIYTIPNILTASRLVAAPFIGYCILNGHHTWALGLFTYAGVSDLLDGWIARRWKLQTVVGSVIDPMADKMLMTVLTVSLAMQGSLPAWLAVIILGRDVGLGIAAIYYRWISLPPPKTFTRYWDFSLPSAEVHPTTISKYNTFLQLALMGATTLAPVIPSVDMAPALGVMQYVVATTTIWSGASYVYSTGAVVILNKDSQKDESKK